MRHLLLSLICIAAVFAGETKPPERTQVEALASEAQAWLLSQQQPDGALVPGKTFTLGVTAMAVVALSSPPHALTADHPAMIKALTYIDSFKQKDGGIYAVDEGMGNYTTSLALQVYARLRPQDQVTITAAQRYLLACKTPTKTVSALAASVTVTKALGMKIFLIPVTHCRPCVIPAYLLTIHNCRQRSNFSKNAKIYPP
jgi:hypothetical protein